MATMEEVRLSESTEEHATNAKHLDSKGWHWIFQCIFHSCNNPFSDKRQPIESFHCKQSAMDHVFGRHHNFPYNCHVCSMFWRTFDEFQGHLQDVHPYVSPMQDAALARPSQMTQLERDRCEAFYDQYIVKRCFMQEERMTVEADSNVAPPPDAFYVTQQQSSIKPGQINPWSGLPYSDERHFLDTYEAREPQPPNEVAINWPRPVDDLELDRNYGYAPREDEHYVNPSVDLITF